MRILFINPNLRPGHSIRYLPVGLAYVMTVVRHAGHDFDLLDIGLYDYSDAQVEDYLASHAYDVVLTGSIVTHYKWMKWLTRTVRRHQPQATIVVGNSVGGSIPEVFLGHSEADVVVIGARHRLSRWRRPGGPHGPPTGRGHRRHSATGLDPLRRGPVLRDHRCPFGLRRRRG